METKAERRIAVFLDFENLVTNTGITAADFDLRPTFDRLLEKGKVVFRRAYCNWSRFAEPKKGLHELGFELVDVPPSTRAGKNAADMRLVIDALELCYAREHIDTFAIASGDSDFCPLVHKLRENDRLVVGIAVREAASPLLVKACDEFIYLKSEGKSRPKARSEAQPSKTRGKGAATPRAAPRAPDIAREVVTSLIAQATGPINPSLIKQAIVRKEPDFDERDHGFSTFMKMLAELEREGVLKRQQVGRQWYVVPVEVGAVSPPNASEAGEQRAPDAGTNGDDIPF